MTTPLLPAAINFEQDILKSVYSLALLPKFQERPLFLMNRTVFHSKTEAWIVRMTTLLTVIILSLNMIDTFFWSSFKEFLKRNTAVYLFY